MDKERTRVCCNCGKCVRERREDGHVDCYCEQRGHRYMGYLEVMSGWCRHWCRDRKWDEVENGKT